MAPSNLRQRARHEPLFDTHPMTGASIEVFYADRSLETFGWQAPVGSGALAAASRQAVRQLVLSPRVTRRIETR